MAGRKSKYTPECVDKIIQAIEVGATDGDACAAAGIHPDTFYTWQRTKPEFSDRVTCARPKGWIADLAVIRRAAINGDWRAAEAHLALTRSPYRKSPETQITLTVNLQEIAAKVASDYGLDPDAVIAEAESILAGKS